MLPSHLGWIAEEYLPGEICGKRRNYQPQQTFDEKKQKTCDAETLHQFGD